MSGSNQESNKLLKEHESIIYENMSRRPLKHPTLSQTVTTVQRAVTLVKSSSNQNLAICTLFKLFVDHIGFWLGFDSIVMIPLLQFKKLHMLETAVCEPVGNM